eukprot:8022-Heterococcus_DN1.PRE.1
MDYSGMVDGLFEGNTLLNEVDGMVRNAIKCQVSVSTTMEDMLTILVEFRETLGAMTLPRPATVDYRQALTDAQREVQALLAHIAVEVKCALQHHALRAKQQAIRVNGSLKHNGDTEELLASLRTLVAPLVFDEALTDQVCQDIIRASSRTASGGDTYSAMTSLLAMPEAGYLLTPNGEESLPIDINVDATKGEVVITVENSFLLRRGDPMDSGINSSSGSLAKTFRARLEKAKLRMDPLKVMGGARKNKDKLLIKRCTKYTATRQPVGRAIVKVERHSRVRVRVYVCVYVYQYECKLWNDGAQRLIPAAVDAKHAIDSVASSQRAPSTIIIQDKCNAIEQRTLVASTFSSSSYERLLMASADATSPAVFCA